MDKNLRLTNQQYFVKTVDYLRNQTHRSFDFARDGCTYLANDGNKCAIGHWIPDGHRAQESVYFLSEVAKRFPDLVGVAWPNTLRGLSLATALQRLHDGENFRKAFSGGLSLRGEAEAKQIARKFGLVYHDPAV